MRGAEGGDRGRGFRIGLRVLVASLVLAVLIVSGAAAGDSAFPYDQGGSGLSAARMGAKVLAPAVAAARWSAGEGEAAGAVRELLQSGREGGLDPRDLLSTALPPPDAVLALLALDRDIDDFTDNAATGGRAGAYYRDEARLAGELRPRRQAFFAVFEAAYAELGPSLPSRLDQGVLPYGPGSGINRPPLAELAYSHPYALDLFFEKVRNRADGQEGPAIPSLSDGIVVAAASNWRGGAGLGAWESGGLSPSSGNGVVVYDAVHKRVFSYFHFRSTPLRVGDIVRAGSLLGVGGNTGVNARKPGHGEHLHVEIYDTEEDRPLNSREILRLVTRD